MGLFNRRAPEPPPASSEEEDWDGPDDRFIWEPGDWTDDQ